jgi:hypothetical protein
MRNRETQKHTDPQIQSPNTDDPRVGIKKPTQKNHLKNPLKMGFLVFFFNFLFFMKIIQTFLFQTDFFEQISNKLSFIYQKIVRYALN